jgi:hypothetical protein
VHKPIRKSSRWIIRDFIRQGALEALEIKEPLKIKNIARSAGFDFYYKTSENLGAYC